MENNYRFDTKLVHSSFEKDPMTQSNIPPLYQTTAYHMGTTENAKELFELKTPGNIYTRLMNPTNDVLEKRVADLDGGVGALAFSSGHAAIFNTIINLANAGDEIVSSQCIYGGAINMLGVSLKRIGIDVKFVDPDDLDAWESSITEKTRAFFFEIVGNPNANIADIEKIAAIAHRHGIPVIADSTFTTPYLCRPIEFGADIVIHSSSKFIGGHGLSMGGIVVDSGKFSFLDNPRFPLYNQSDPSYHGMVFAKDCKGAEFITRLRVLVMRDLGSCASPFNSFTFLIGLETLALRMRRHCDNALQVAEHLEKNDHILFVNYPGLKSNKYHSLQEKYLPNGSGAVFTFGIKGNRDTCGKFIDQLSLIQHVANVGDVRTLVLHPATTTHSQLTDEQLIAGGITSQTVRISVGIEDVNDLIADIDRAIQKAVQ